MTIEFLILFVTFFSIQTMQAATVYINENGDEVISFLGGASSDCVENEDEQTIDDYFKKDDAVGFAKKFAKIEDNDRKHILITYSYYSPNFLRAIQERKLKIAEWFLTKQQNSVDVNMIDENFNRTPQSAIFANLETDLKELDKNKESIKKMLYLLKLIIENKNFSVETEEKNMEFNEKFLPEKIIELISNIKEAHANDPQTVEIVASLENAFETVIRKHPECIHLKGQLAENNSPLNIALYHKNFKLAKSLLSSKKFDMKKESQEEIVATIAYSLLADASINESELLTIIKTIINRPDFDINTKDEYEQSLLYHAVFKEKEQIVQLLCNNSHIDPNIIDDKNRTPIYFANPTCKKILINHPKMNLLLEKEERYYLYQELLTDKNDPNFTKISEKAMTQATEKGKSDIICDLIKNYDLKPTAEAIAVLEKKVKEDKTASYNEPYTSSENESLTDIISQAKKKGLAPSKETSANLNNNIINGGLIIASGAALYYDIKKFVRKNNQIKKSNFIKKESVDKKDNIKKTELNKERQRPTENIALKYFKDLKKPLDHLALLVPLAFALFKLVK